MSKGRFCDRGCVVCFRQQMYIWDILWSDDDTKKASILHRRECFATLNVWRAFDHRCTSGIYFKVMTTPRRPQSNVEGKDLLPSMCGRFSIRHLLLEYTFV